MVRTFLDSGVLLTAAPSVSRDRERALEVLADSSRVLIASPYVRLEIWLKAVFHKRNWNGPSSNADIGLRRCKGQATCYDSVQLFRRVEAKSEERQVTRGSLG